MQETEALKISQDVVEEMACQVPAIYLTECEDLEGYVGGDLMSVYEVTKKNNEKASECIVIHNALVELLKNR